MIGNHSVASLNSEAMVKLGNLRVSLLQILGPATESHSEYPNEAAVELTLDTLS